MVHITRQKRITALIILLFVLLSVLLSAETYAEKEDLVSYTVFHMDEEGNTLADTQVFFGHPGDVALVSCREIEGYEPDKKELRKKLSEDEKENVFTFTYSEEKSAGSGGNMTAVIVLLIAVQLLIFIYILRRIRKRR